MQPEKPAEHLTDDKRWSPWVREDARLAADDMRYHSFFVIMSDCTLRLPS
jgi:hypothetical protein